MIKQNYMFETLKELVGKLSNDTDFSKYSNSKDTRKVLQAVKVEAQVARVKVMAAFKNKAK